MRTPFIPASPASGESHPKSGFRNSGRSPLREQRDQLVHATTESLRSRVGPHDASNFGIQAKGDIPPLWRSLDELRGAAATAAARDEFPEGATLWPADLNRRDFLKLIGGSLALAGLTACGGRPEKIVPYVNTPENVVPGQPAYYATAMPLEGYARGILVESHLGRPTKIEGNPNHPDSLGATDAMTQAAVMSLYDPDRSRAPRREGQLRNWETFQSEWLAHQQQWSAGRGRGLAILTEPTTSPTELRELHRVLDTLPEARWFQHTPLARYDLDGRQAEVDFAAADVIFSIGSNFLHRHPAALRHSREFAKRRRVVDGRVDLNRLFAIDATPTVTSALADVRLPLAPPRVSAVLNAIAARFDGSGGSHEQGLTEGETRFVKALVDALQAHPATAVCLAGPEQSAGVQRWALGMNGRLGSVGRVQRFLPAIRSDADERATGFLPDLAEAIASGGVNALLILGGNPVYTAPAEIDFAALLRRVPTTLHLGSSVDETAVHCGWHLPESHFLETWSDLRAYDGTATVQQPLIEPRFPGRSAAELLRLITEPNGRPAYDLVRETWQESSGPDNFDVRWSGWLNTGVVERTRAPYVDFSPPPPSPLPPASEPGAGTLVLEADAKLLDGRFANNPWLQELPHPISHLVWDNAALVAPAFADSHQLQTGDMIALESGGRLVEAAVLVQPGQAPDTIALSLGYGRTRAGSVGNGRGFNAYPLRSAGAPWHVPGLRVRKLDRSYELISTQGHFTMEGRDLVRRVTPDDLHTERKAHRSLYPSWPRGAYAWGMSIDLSTCIGCHACVTACQAENNIPTVGKEQVARGREMLWLRVDRYYSGEPGNPQMLPQPVPCMQCENAPCELVCPVGATVHSSEGLNDMVYNRCVGTRYCSNNCPYKVRRFNFLDYRAPATSPVHLQDNPDVTVRERGVMEKCTYCVQRINAARIAAEKENRRVRDGEIKTACQQVCPAEAIVFGDLNDPDSRVNRRKREPIDYSLLEELNTRPRTTYLAKVLAARTAPLPVAAADRGDCVAPHSPTIPFSRSTSGGEA